MQATSFIALCSLPHGRLHEAFPVLCHQPMQHKQGVVGVPVLLQPNSGEGHSHTIAAMQTSQFGPLDPCVSSR